MREVLWSLLIDWSCQLRVPEKRCDRLSTGRGGKRYRRTLGSGTSRRKTKRAVAGGEGSPRVVYASEIAATVSIKEYCVHRGLRQRHQQ